MTIDHSTLQALAGRTLGPASLREQQDTFVVDVLGRSVSIEHEAELVRCSAAGSVERPAGADPSEFDSSLRDALGAAELGHPDLVKLIYAPANGLVYCYAWLGIERSVADLLLTARRCAALAHLAENVVARTAAMIGVEDELRTIEEELSSLDEGP